MRLAGRPNASCPLTQASSRLRPAEDPHEEQLDDVGVKEQELRPLVPLRPRIVGVIVTISVAEIMNGGKGTGGWIGWTVFIYTFLANSLFLVCMPVAEARASRGVANTWL